MLNIMTSRPMVTMMRRVKLNQPMTIALVPTPDKTLPLARVLGYDAGCYRGRVLPQHRDEDEDAGDEDDGQATCDTGRDGNGLTSRSEPSLSSSSCHPGKVARRRRQMKAKMMAIMLHDLVSRSARN